MHLRRIEIKNFRSLYDNRDGEPAFALDLSDGLNLLVGQNNCGKSNVLRAVALAMDPAFPFDRAADLPAQKKWAYPTVSLVFQVPGRTGPEKTLLKYASEYERSVKQGTRATTYADDGEVHLLVQYTGTDYRRSERIKIRGVGNRQGPPEQRDKVLRQLRSVVSFVMLESGQSLEAMLEGRFREILHSVIRDHLRDHLTQAREHRTEYVRKLEEELLAPLRDQVRHQLSGVFPEILEVELAPGVSEVERAIAEVTVQLTDAASTPLANKGTGVRGGVIIAMLRYLAAQSKRSMIFAVEEPEAFLHPAAQRALAGDLVELACAPDVSLIATTHSPFMLPRDPRITVTSLEKDDLGRTRIIGQGSGAAHTSRLLAPLFGDLGTAAVFERTTQFDAGTRAVVLVEGGTDERYLRIAAERSGRDDLLDGIVVEPVGGTTNLLGRASQLLAVCPFPLVVLLDHDDEGRKAHKLVCDLLKLRTGEQLLHYGRFMEGEFGWEAEDLFPPALIEAWIAEVGDRVATSGRSMRPDGTWHYDVLAASKWPLAEWLAEQAGPDDVDRWVEVLLAINAAVARQLERERKKEARTAQASDGSLRSGGG